MKKAVESEYMNYLAPETNQSEKHIKFIYIIV